MMINALDLAHLAEQAKAVFAKPPRVHAFRTPRRPYVYDTNTGQIVATNALGLSILQELGKPTLTAFLAQKALTLGEDKVCTALTKILALATGSDMRLLSTQEPKILRYCSNRPAYRAALESSLQQMTVFLTSACNLNCYYCVYSGKYEMRSDHRSGSMSPETLLAALAYFVAHSVEAKEPSFGFYGGEAPLLFDDVKRAVSFLRREMGNRKYRVQLSTNLVDISSDVMDVLIKEDIFIYVSLDGPKHVHDRYRVAPDGSGSFDRVMENLKRLRAQEPTYYSSHVTFNAVLAPPVRVKDIRDFLFQNELVPYESFALGSVEDPHMVFEDCSSSFLDVSELRELRAEYLARVRRGYYEDPLNSDFLSKLFDRSFLDTYRRQRSPGIHTTGVTPGGVCKLGVRRLHVRHDGAVFPCERIREHDAFNLGNIRDGAIDADKIFRLMDTHASLCESECAKCWASLQCGKICMKEYYDDQGAPSRDLRLAACEEFRRDESAALIQMCEVLEENPRAFDFLNRYSSE